MTIKLRERNISDDNVVGYELLLRSDLLELVVIGSLLVLTKPPRLSPTIDVGFVLRLLRWSYYGLYSPTPTVVQALPRLHILPVTSHSSWVVWLSPRAHASDPSFTFWGTTPGLKKNVSHPPIFIELHSKNVYTHTRLWTLSQKKLTILVFLPVCHYRYILV
jgi:hypothetical protein